MNIGDRIGVHKILAKLGEGGMGQVYQARDTRLDRDVAIKVLPQEFVADPERVARFEREAKTLASLNHPHIGGIYGLEDADGVKALVLELVEGPTLADRIAQGALPIDEALPIARQIAEALEAAHEQGIIHRDLKPANIKVRQDGTVKVLDFGLAKAAEPTGGAASRMSMSPTLSLHATYAGVILGTAAYMSPEQARGRLVDRRTDVWAFGCVLFEMLSGARPFDGEDLAETIGAVIHKDPAWDRLPAGTPGTVRRVLQRCLQKDPKERIRDIGDVQLALKGAFDVPVSATEPSALMTSPARPLWKRSVPVISAALLAGAIVGGAAWMLRPPEPVRSPVVRFALPLGEGQQFTVANNQMLAISPDGALITYVANNQLYVRKMSDPTARPIGTQQTTTPFSPVFSPDGRWIAFFSQPDQAIKKISVSGGAAITICPAQPARNGRITWDGETILFGQPAGVMRVSANGGKPELIVKVGETEGVHGPQLLPGGEWLLFTLGGAPGSNDWDKAQIVVQSLKTSERRTLIDGASDGRYLSSGHLVYAVAGVLYAVPFDLDTLSLAGDRVPVVEGIRRALSGLSAATQFSVSDTGSLVFVSGPAAAAADQFDIALIDREGKINPLKLPAGPYRFPRLSPDGTRLAVGKEESNEAVIWIYDMSGINSMRRLTLEGRNRLPVWAPDSAQIVFQSDREGDWALFRQRVDGTSPAERLTKPAPNERHFPESWSPDNRTLLFSAARDNKYFLQALSVADGKTTPFGEVQSIFPISAAFSPDGKWVAYSAADPGRPAGRLLVQPFPPTGAVFPVSSENGIHPAWSANSKELTYSPRIGLTASVLVTAAGSAFTFSTPVTSTRVFFDNGPTFERNNDVAKDGRYLGLVAHGQTGAPGTQEAPPELQVVLNWLSELKERVPEEVGQVGQVRQVGRVGQ